MLPKFNLGQGQPKVVIILTMMGQRPQCYTPSFVEISPPVPEKNICLRFFKHIWAWRPSWSCDLDHLYKVSFPPPPPKDAPHDVWL